MASTADLIARDVPDDPPDGYKPLPTGLGFMQLLGPIYCRLQDRQLTLGMRISPRHLNPMRTSHGGLLATFADMQSLVAQCEGSAIGRSTPTVTLSVDYLAPVLLGDWLEGDATLLRATRKLLFTQLLAKVGERPVFRSSGIFKIGPVMEFKGTKLNEFFQIMREK